LLFLLLLLLLLLRFLLLLLVLLRLLLFLPCIGGRGSGILRRRVPGRGRLRPGL
jgi:hypothetical protein